MYTRTLQSHKQTGDTYVLEYDEINIIRALSEPLYYVDADALTTGTLWDVEVSEDDALWANDQQWQPPRISTEEAGR